MEPTLEPSRRPRETPAAATPAVLQVVPALVSGGVERGTVEMAAALTAAGWRAYVASSGGPLAGEVQRAGGRHIELPLASKNLMVMRRNIRRLAEVIEREQIHLVHARSRAPAWSAFYAARRTGAHFVTTFHNAYGLDGGRFKRQYNSIMARGERVIAISAYVAQHVSDVYGVGSDRLRLIHRGVDLQRFDPARVGRERIVTVAQAWRLTDGQSTIVLPGRITRWKGHLLLVEALAKLGRHDFTCIFVGAEGDKADYRLEVEARIAALGLGGNVRFAPASSDMPAAYMMADVVVSASTTPEGFGRVVVEAQAMGRPVIATDHGGARETVVPGVTGWLVPPGDPDAMAAALGQALALTLREREELAARAIQHARTYFDTAFMTDRTLAVYEELLYPPAVSVGLWNAAEPPP